LSKLYGALNILISDKEKFKKQMLQNNKQLLLNRKTVLFLTAVSEETKKNVISSLESIVSMALNCVYGDGHKFEIVLENRRNQVEADFFIDDSNTRIQLKKPFVGKGGGKVTIAAFALQLAIIEYSNITGPLFLDEITRYVDKQAVGNVALFLKEYSLSNERQVINITHHEEVAETADIKYGISKDKNGAAIVRRIE
jgi:DNA repair ATPase RecN